VGSVIQFVRLYPPEVNSTKTARNAIILGFTSTGKIKLSFCDDPNFTFLVKPERIADCAVLIQIENIDG
jgi:hypothetical protein